MAFIRLAQGGMGLGYAPGSSKFGFGNITTGTFNPSYLAITAGFKIQMGSTFEMGRLNVGSELASYESLGRLNTEGATGSNTDRVNTSVSIYAEGHLLGSMFEVISDARIKKELQVSDSVKDLDTLLGIQITDYQFRDTLANGNATQKKVIAQQVDKVFPQAVQKRVGVVPDVFKNADLKDGWILLATDLKVGDRVRLISDKEQAIQEVVEVRDDAFRTAQVPDRDKVFVYGREVPDFHSIDYDAIAMLNVSATQAVHHKMVKLENEMKAKDARISELARQVVDLAAAEGEREERLLALERRVSGTDSAKNPEALKTVSTGR